MNEYDIPCSDSFIHVTEDGEDAGTPVLLISGFIGIASFWQPMVPCFAAAYRIIRFDQRGTGGSGPFESPLSMAQMAEDALAVLLKIGRHPVHVVGHSAGAGVGIMLAASHPELVASLTIVGGWTKADMWMKCVFEARLEALDLKGTMEYLRLTTLFMYPESEPRLRAHFMLEEENKGLQSFPGASHIHARASAVLEWDSAIFSSQVACPALVIGCADDRMTPYHFSEALAQEIRSASLHRMEEGGHYCVRSRPNETLRPILEFLGNADAVREERKEKCL